MSDKDALLINQDERGVLTLTLNRPKVRNAFDDMLIANLLSALKNAAIDPQVRAIVLRGNGAVFCAGADLQWMQRMVNYSYAENVDDANQLAALMRTLASMPHPTVAVIQGAAYGGGVGLAACCDLVIAEESAKFCLSEVKLGLIPAVISPFLLSRMGQKSFRRYAFTAEVFDAIAAKEHSLVDECVPAMQLEACLETFLQMLLTASPAAIRAMKKLLQDIEDCQKPAALTQITVEAIANIRVSEEGQEGLKAFLEKRKPSFSV
ncbi:MAG: Enoyl-CoA hydratase/isomerase [Gammaproteobacteria bacterium]|jgi:methylglutaconyl-CoA hydratase|nr:Enoyl-CoA hydratase/isomerase [Gammaproteobacteria bacterium]